MEDAMSEDSEPMSEFYDKFDPLIAETSRLLASGGWTVENLHQHLIGGVGPLELELDLYRILGENEVEGTLTLIVRPRKVPRMECEEETL
jgi:hypothetical protein